MPPQQAEQYGVYHQVQRGQTLWGIAQAYGTTVTILAKANRLSSVDMLEVGQRLYIPGATEVRAVTRRCPCRSASDTVHTTTSFVPPRPPFSTPQPSPRQERLAQINGDIRFAWPVEGTVSRRFEQEGLRRHDGIDIPAAKDTPIRAAADGVVLFSDWGPGGYGRIVIIRHDQDMVTLYAHNERNLVQVGQTVRQGEQIATVGKTGRATAYHVHFEIRHKTTPVSPLQYLRSPRQLVQLGAR